MPSKVGALRDSWRTDQDLEENYGEFTSRGPRPLPFRKVRLFPPFERLSSTTGSSAVHVGLATCTKHEEDSQGLAHGFIADVD